MEFASVIMSDLDNRHYLSDKSLSRNGALKLFLPFGFEYDGGINEWVELKGFFYI